MRRGRLLIAAGLLAAAAAAATLFVVGSLGGSDRELLPDLNQAAPGELSGRTLGSGDNTRFLLGFESAAGNVGEGALTITGSRPNVGQREMTVVQQVHREDGSIRNEPVQATLRYVRSADHEHWHMLDFMSYELRRAEGTLVRPDRKTGFCLGDRYEVGVSLRRAKPTPTYTDECGKGRRQLLRLQEGISVGYGDDYDAHLEGQSFDITGLPAGDYLLVHRVNSRRVLRESDYSNNDSSMAFALAWPSGNKRPPSLSVIQRCPDKATCP